MDKPLTVKRQEFAEKLTDLINSSGLYAFVMADLMKNCIRELDVISLKEYEAEMRMWNSESEKDK